MTPLIIERLKALPQFQRRVHGASGLAALMVPSAVPLVTPCLHVVPTAIVAPRGPVDVTGGYIQSIDRGYAVVLSLRLHDPHGAQAMDEAAALIEAVIRCLCGWEPTPESIGVFVFRRALLMSFDKGVATFEIDFSLPDQLRI